jgi:hypothetical protein
VGLSNLERFGESLDEWFGREDTPLWITEYGHETFPAEPLGVDPPLQAKYVEDALTLAVGNPRIRMFLWFILRDRVGNPWQSGLVAEDGTAKPALDRFSQLAQQVDGRNPVLPAEAEVVRVPALELAYHSAVGTPIDVSVGSGEEVAVPLERDGWLDVPLDARAGDVLAVHAADPNGHSISRTVRLTNSQAQELD